MPEARLGFTMAFTEHGKGKSTTYAVRCGPVVRLKVKSSDCLRRHSACRRHAMMLQVVDIVNRGPEKGKDGKS